ncbi:MAG TPA: hypothetical protein DD640_08290, partial [Clostridiales bacterium]|nr:hypothetical protein [Clostridiales bacterium]
MMIHLYLSLIPEALIASMLEPADFAAYYALGEHDKPNGQAVFVEIDPTFRHEFFPIELGLARCVPGADGKPKSSVYISIYRVMEHIPITAMGDLYYVTRDGRSLRTGKTPAVQNDGGLHFYYELAPVRLSVVSSLGPVAFNELLLGHQKDFQGLPAIAFIEMELGELANDPE